MSEVLQALIAQRKGGHLCGITSVCSAHALVIEAAMRQAQDDGQPVLIEATCNQVNQLGGYTGMTPLDFKAYVQAIAARAGFDWQQVVLGGDHLGPNPWKHLPAEQAMAHALELLKSYAEAGFRKLHLDASMPCADDPAVLPDSLISARAAALCQAAESAAPDAAFVYVIGTEVPVPGGATESLSALAVTSKAAALNTLALHRQAFEARGLHSAWGRVIALVVQPGVEFDHDQVMDYVPAQARDLSALLGEVPGLVFEAHSTDYQRPDALAALVRDGFAILKVGPGLTFALREALQALALIEAQTIAKDQQSALMQVLDAAMLEQPANWQPYYHGSAQQQQLLRTYSYSDRCRYYWNHPRVQQAVHTLFANLEHSGIAHTLLSQFLPAQYAAVRLGRLANTPQALVMDHIRNTLRPYASACKGFDTR